MKLALAVVLALAAAASADGALPACETVRCAEACLDNPTRCTTRCNAMRRCPANMACINGLCDCPQDMFYQKRRCRPIVQLDPSCAAVQCLQGSTCKDGKCSMPTSTRAPFTTAYNKCITVKCSAGYVCYDGRCLPIFTRPVLTTDGPSFSSS